MKQCGHGHSQEVRVQEDKMTVRLWGGKGNSDIAGGPDGVGITGGHENSRIMGEDDDDDDGVTGGYEQLLRLTDLFKISDTASLR